MDRIIEALSTNGFALADYMVFIVYIIILVGMGMFLSRSKKGQEKSSTDYFLAGNTLTWWAVGASLIAANISAEQFIGMSGSAFASGIAQAAYELMAAATLLVVGKFLLPLMIEKKIFTIPQFLRERYNWGVGFAFSLLWLFLYVFVNLTSVAWLGALAIQQILGLPTDMTFTMAGMEIDQVRMVCSLDRRDAGDLPRWWWFDHRLCRPVSYRWRDGLRRRLGRSGTHQGLPGLNRW